MKIHRVVINAVCDIGAKFLLKETQGEHLRILRFKYLYASRDRKSEDRVLSARSTYRTLLHRVYIRFFFFFICKYNELMRRNEMRKIPQRSRGTEWKRHGNEKSNPAKY